MAIKNYTTKVSTVQTVGEIQAILAKHGARKIMMDYSETGDVITITFALIAGQNTQGFKLTPNYKGVLSVMKKDGIKCDEIQAQRIAWRNTKDWIDSQIALVEAEQASMDELFLPYMVNGNGDTVYQLYTEGKKLLGDGFNE